MITVTERAASALESLLIESNAEAGQGVKLFPKGADQIGMAIDTPNEGDEVIQHGDGPLLIVDQALTRPLDGAEFDCEETLNGQAPTRFALRR
jgi:Fe-S cluster assembly iron-binding protein IscA